METALFLTIDGFTNGAVYGLVALSLVIVFTITRVVNIAQGEYVTMAALSLAGTIDGALPALLPIVIGAILFLTSRDLITAHASRRFLRRMLALRGLWIAALALGSWYTMINPSYLAAMAISLALVTSLGPIIYRLTVEPAPNAPPIVLVIITVGVFMVMHGVTVLLFGAEPRRVAPITDGGILAGPVFIQYQSLWIVGISLVALILLYSFFRFTLTGRALEAVAINRLGAQLCGIPVRWAGQASFALAAALSSLSGMLLAPLVTANFDMGFVIGLKGFVGGALGGLVEYPLAIAGVLGLGIFEAFGAYYASAYRDALVFGLLIPILLWRNYSSPPQDAHE